MKPLMLLAVLGVLLSGCEDSTSPKSSANTQHNTVTVNNQTMCAAKQLVRLDITPVGGGATISRSFVCNYGEQTPIQIAVPGTGNYRVEVFSADGQSMWWDSVALALPGNTTLRVSCGGSPIVFWGDCASLSHSGVTMVP